MGGFIFLKNNVKGFFYETVFNFTQCFESSLIIFSFNQIKSTAVQFHSIFFLIFNFLIYCILNALIKEK